MSTYATEKVLRALVIDDRFRHDLQEDPGRVLEAADPPLDADERQALLAGDVGTLSRRGVNNFLLWQLARYGFFGLDNEVYAQRIRKAYAAERVQMRAKGLLG